MVLDCNQIMKKSRLFKTLNNLAKNLDYKEKINELSSEMDRWIKAINNKLNLPEAELVNKLCKVSDTKPQTAQSILSYSNGIILISFETEGDSIEYKIKTKNADFPKTWSIYTVPFSVPENAKLMVQSHRIGFKPSSLKRIKVLDL